MKKALVLLTVLAGGSAMLGLGTHVWYWWRQAPEHARVAVVAIGEGRSLNSVARQLQREGLLDRPRLWSLMARLRGLDGQIKRGEYELGGMSPADLLGTLVAGRVRRYSIALPEGIALREALEILRGDAVLEPVLDGVSDPRLLALVAPRDNPEGLFFPDTYNYVRGDSDLDVLAQARRRMDTVLDGAWRSRAPGLPYGDRLEALTMASIVEKETGLAAERERIAGVFVRRLRMGMRLQSDPTIIYGLGGAYAGDLRRGHIEDESNPYNTYRHKGLPPGPIGLPGAAAIEAAMHPATGNELYFVARGDGSHQFSETLGQHRAAVRQYQLRRRADYRSSPVQQDTR